MAVVVVAAAIEHSVDIVLDVDSLVVDIVEDDHRQVLEDNHHLDASLDNLDEVEAVVVAAEAVRLVEVVVIVA